MRLEMMFLWCVLVLVNLVSVATDTNAGDKVRLTQKGLEYGKIQVVNLGLPKSALRLVPGTGVMLSIDNAYINLRGNWRVKYFRFIRNSGTLDLSVSKLTVSTTIAITSDNTGRPMSPSVVILCPFAWIDEGSTPTQINEDSEALPEERSAYAAVSLWTTIGADHNHQR
ncbi:bactericidal permeability-increasing -like protein [Labeo rohita]|uniref:Bactericidal permeability-increasing protein n=1 Tax=Labeo rohita TaxID=84645 RepID=A0A498L736_LABRO|nr:bactericidal permeability-increasing -like protein [Labeo rohita]